MMVILIDLQINKKIEKMERKLNPIKNGNVKNSINKLNKQRM